MWKRAPIYLLIVVCLLLSISLWKNCSYASEKKQLRANMLSTSVYALQSISTNLGELLTEIEEETMPYEKCEDKLILISGYFTELHFALKTFATHFPPPGVTRNSYSGNINFEFIGHTLVGGWGEINYNRFNGIMFDNTVSDKEIQYLTSLKESVDNMIEALAPKDSQYQIDEISPSYLDEVISDFTEKFYVAYDDNPLNLLIVN